MLCSHDAKHAHACESKRAHRQARRLPDAQAESSAMRGRRGSQGKPRTTLSMRVQQRPGRPRLHPGGSRPGSTTMPEPRLPVVGMLQPYRSRTRGLVFVRSGEAAL